MEDVGDRGLGDQDPGEGRVEGHRVLDLDDGGPPHRGYEDRHNVARLCGQQLPERAEHALDGGDRGALCVHGKDDAVAVRSYRPRREGATVAFELGELLQLRRDAVPGREDEPEPALRRLDGHEDARPEREPALPSSDALIRLE